MGRGGWRAKVPNVWRTSFFLESMKSPTNKHCNYLTLFSNHHSEKLVYGEEGKSASSLNGFFSELESKRTEKITAVTIGHGIRFR